jgi:hypothetical protein
MDKSNSVAPLTRAASIRANAISSGVCVSCAANAN